MPTDRRSIFRNTGPRRYCVHCKQQVSTYRGRFVIHLAAHGRACPGSEQPVPKPAEPDTGAPLADD